MISITLLSPRPKPTPIKVEAVNYETLLPEMSPILFLFENYTLILALEADERRKHTFLPILPIDASKRKCCGYFNVRISMYIDMFRATCAMNLHFFISSSKFLPYLLANNMPPNYPRPSLRTQV